MREADAFPGRNRYPLFLPPALEELPHQFHAFHSEHALQQFTPSFGLAGAACRDASSAPVLALGCPAQLPTGRASRTTRWGATPRLALIAQGVLGAPNERPSLFQWYRASAPLFFDPVSQLQPAPARLAERPSLTADRRLPAPLPTPTPTAPAKPADLALFP